MIGWWDEAPEFMTDEELLATYERTSGEPRVVRTEALLAEIKRRGLDLAFATGAGLRG